MTKTQILILEKALATLTGDNASPEIQAALADPNLKIWLDTWVRYPLALTLANGKGEIDAEGIKFLAR